MGRIFRTVHEEVTDHRLAELAGEMSAADKAIDDAEIERKDEMGTWRNKLKKLREKKKEIRTAIDNRQISRVIECEEVLFPEEGVARMRRLDTKEFTGEQRALTTAERQIPIPYAGAGKEGFVDEGWPEGAPFERGALVWFVPEEDDELHEKGEEIFEVVAVKEPEVVLGESPKWLVTAVEYDPEDKDAAVTITRPAEQFDHHRDMQDRRNEMYPTVAQQGEEPADDPDDDDEDLDDEDLDDEDDD